MDLRNTQQQVQDSHMTRFYERLGEIFSTWIPLEDVYYRNTEFGENVELGKFTEVPKWHDLEFFHITIAKNGGPIALMIQDNTLFIGTKEIKSQIFVVSGTGKKVSSINLPEKLGISKEKLRWASMHFTAEEDLLLISCDGVAYLIDPMTGEQKEKVPIGGELRSGNGIVDSKLYEGGTLVLRDTQNRFYWIPNIALGYAAQAFEYVPSLATEAITDYLLIPKGAKGATAMQLLVADPVDGLWVISETKKVSQLRDISGAPFGKVQYMALNAKKELLALYCEAQTKGRIIVMKATLNAEFNRFDTKLIHAKSLEWCGNDAPCLAFPDRVVIVGPGDKESIDIRCAVQGIKIMNEIDGLRIFSSEKTYFLERVQPKMLSTFKVASISASAKLLQAQKSVDLNQPKADDIINELGAKNLIQGIDDLLETSTCEHQNVAIMKHLLRTASFAKTFPEASGYDSNNYVNIVKHMVVLTKIRNSPNCARAITFKQFEKFKAKNILKLMLKFRDYRLALLTIDQLSLKQYTSMVYDDWCQTMIKYSKLSDQELEFKLSEKFDQLKIKMAEDQGLNPQMLQYNISGGGLTPQQRDMIMAGRTESADINRLIARQLPPSLKINIDFTKLAKTAATTEYGDKKQKRLELANFLIKQEKSIVKKIPFLLENQSFEEALKFAIEGGDPNIINKVFTEILSFFKGNIKQVLECARGIRDGERHLRNYAKSRQRIDILTEMIEQLPPSVKPTDLSAAIVQIRMAMSCTNLDARRDFQNAAGKFLGQQIKDDFFVKGVEEMLEIQEREKDLFKGTKDPRVMDASTADFYQVLIGKGKEGESQLRDINKSLKLGDKYHFMMIIRAQAKAGQWDDIKEFIRMKKPPVTYSFLAEVCHEFGKVPFAVDAIKKISDYDEKIPMLIDIGQWRDAVEESFQGKKLEYLDDIRQKGPAFVEDFIKEEQTKRQK